MFKTVDTIRGPFDPGGQPSARIDNPLELGFFAWNVSSGLSATKAVLANPERYQDYWQWPIASRLIQEAERVGFDYHVPYGQWVGMGGPSAWNEANLDFATAAAATVPITSRMKLFSSVHVAYHFHPLHIAKIGAAIDHISGGRWGLNIVAGAKEREFRAFGYPGLPSTEDRYALADEFTTLMKHLWTADEPINFDGEFFHSHGAYINPRPLSSPRPVLMNAGQSEAGLDFACKQADWVFVAPPSGTVETYAELVGRVHAKAAKYGRNVHVAVMSYAVMDATDERAAETVQWLEDEIDYDAVTRLVRWFKGSSQQESYGIELKDQDQFAGLGRETFMQLGLGMGGYQFFGSYDTVAEQMRALHEVGVESVVVGFFDPLKGLHDMEDHIIPRLRKMGLRK